MENHSKALFPQGFFRFLDKKPVSICERERRKNRGVFVRNSPDRCSLDPAARQIVKPMGNCAVFAYIAVF